MTFGKFPGKKLSFLSFVVDSSFHLSYLCCYECVHHRKLIWKNGATYEGGFKNGKKMDLVFLLIQEKVNLIFKKVFGKMTKDPEKEHFSGKIEQNMRETFKIVFTMDLAF